MSQLRDTKPANGNWEAALPIGNGKLGAMVFGEAGMEHYQINEDSVWFGGPMNRVNPDARSNLDKVRKLIFDGKIPEAERLLKYAFTSTPQSERPYQTLGDFYIDLMDSVTEAQDFERELDLSTAIHTVKVKDKRTGVTYIREAFASADTNCIITRISADKPGMVSAGATISRMCFYDKAWHTDDSAFMWGNLGRDGVNFCAGIKMTVENGEVESLGEHVIVHNADSIVIFLTAATTFREKKVEEAVKNCLDAASHKSYEQLKEDHVKEYQSYFNQVKLELPYNKELDEMTTDERLQRIDNQNPDNGLVETYFDFGRYLLISCSRPGSLPANLQGIWNKDLNPAWGSKYTININTEMNYWPAEMFGLSECHMPLFDMLERMEVNGRKTAKEMYGCSGFVAHHNTDMWGDTAPQDMYTPATIWPMGGAWLCTHIWTHYEYTQDVEFLKRMYPVLKSAVRFFMEYLVEYNGEYVTNPSVSPENTYILKTGVRGCVCYGPSMDSEILRDLVTQFLDSAKIVGELENDFVDCARNILEKLPKIKVGSKGQILEWIEEYGEAEPGHRHISHLYALHPSSQILMGETPELIDAAKVTLEGRLANGGGHTGWSRAWIMNMYARLWDAEKSYDNLIQLLKKSTLKNLFDNHPPFQIDGNFGSIAAIGEMLLQSNGGRVVLLPALPKEWKTGSIEGIHARGGAVYHIEWENGELKKVKIHAKNEYQTKLIYRNNVMNVNLSENEIVALTIKNFIKQI